MAGERRLRNVDLPVPECPATRVTLSFNSENISEKSESSRAEIDKVFTPMASYNFLKFSVSALSFSDNRSALLKSKTWGIRKDSALTKKRSIKPNEVRGCFKVAIKIT